MNRLETALSPYLLQHKDNPVDWWPWCDEAFAEAKKRDVPLFLSIGYASCHWCHVMAHESFEDRLTADFLNQHFVNIKLDREERPDLDQVYMQALLAMTGHGGWPMSLFLNHQAKPFFAGTYFPKTASHGRIAFIDLLTQLVQFWRNQRQLIEENSQKLHIYLQQVSEQPGSDSVLPELDSLFEHCRSLKQQMDVVNGGFAGAPKFPQVPLWSMLFQLATVEQDNSLIEACYHTADAICNGGIYDHLGGGFARYSTDENWLVPHFEKMLYDNAQLIAWLTDLYAYQPKPLYRQRIEQTIGWLATEMLTEEAVFKSAIDADSEAEEGKYYVWSWQELESLLADDLAAFAAYYGLSPEGNWEGVNILHRNHSNNTAIDPGLLERCKQKLKAQRDGRLRPFEDGKILADWNAMLITALAKASLVFKQPDWLKIAENAFVGLKKLLYQEGDWCHAWRAGKIQKQRLLDDYALLIQAQLGLYAASGNAYYLDSAKADLERSCQLFRENNVFYQIPISQDCVLIDSIPVIDNATPSGNGIMAINLAQLYLITGEPSYKGRWQDLITRFAANLSSKQGVYLSGLIQSLIWQGSGLKIEANWQNKPDRQHLLPVWYLINNPNSDKIEVCDSRQCFQPLESFEALSKYAEK